MGLRLNNTRLLVSDFAACLAFYRDVLGFPVTLDVGVYAELDAGGAVLGLYRKELMAGVVGTSDKPAHAEAQDRMLLAFEVDNVDETYHDLVGRGVRFTVEPQDQPAWELRTAHFRDPDGNLIEIYHSIHEG